AETLFEIGAKEDSRKMVGQLLSENRYIPEEINLSFLLQAGGNDARDEVQTRLNAGLAELFERIQQPHPNAIDFGLSSQIKIEGLFRDLRRIAEADPSYRKTVAAVFAEILKDEVLSLDRTVYRNAANWFIAKGDAEEKAMAEGFLAKHQSNLSD